MIDARPIAAEAQQQAPASRILIMDPGLRLTGGHHWQIDQGYVAEARRRGYRVGVIGHREMTDRLKECRYQPHFRAWTYDQLSDDPISGWLETHHVMTQSVLGDLQRLPIEPDDLILWPTATAAHIQALAIWGADRPNRIMVVPGFGVGLNRANELTGTDAVAWRYAFRALQATRPDAVVGSYFESIEQHRFVAGGMPIMQIPAPQQGEPRDRSEDTPITIGFVGHQRRSKGFHLVPEICGRLKGLLGDRVRFLVHDSGHEEFDVEWSELLALGVEIVREDLAPDEYMALLNRVSVLVLPYSPQHYETLMSGQAADALATGLPTVMMLGSDMYRLAVRYEVNTTPAHQWEAGAIADAAAQVCCDLPHAAERAMQGAALWNARNGIAKLFDALGL